MKINKVGHSAHMRTVLYFVSIIREDKRRKRFLNLLLNLKVPVERTQFTYMKKINLRRTYEFDTVTAFNRDAF